MGWALEEYYPGYFKSLDRVKGPALDEQLAAAGVQGGLYVKAVTPDPGPARPESRPACW